MTAIVESVVKDTIHPTRDQAVEPRIMIVFASAYGRLMTVRGEMEKEMIPGWYLKDVQHSFDGPHNKHLYREVGSGLQSLRVEFPR